ncbi:MAG: ATP-binding protein [Acidimicrobiia bacterium]|nr:ATP-binding protein [Acidimicrobiia bacterium]
MSDQSAMSDRAAMSDENATAPAGLVRRAGRRLRARRWIPHSLGTQLILVSVPFTVLAALGAAAITYSQTRLNVRDEMLSAVARSEVVLSALEQTARHNQGWGGAQDTVVRLATMNDIDLVVWRVDEDLLVADSNAARFARVSAYQERVAAARAQASRLDDGSSTDARPAPTDPASAAPAVVVPTETERADLEALDQLRSQATELNAPPASATEAEAMVRTRRNGALEECLTSHDMDFYVTIVDGLRVARVDAETVRTNPESYIDCTAEAKEAADTLRRELTQAEVLRPPDFPAALVYQSPVELVDRPLSNGLSAKLVTLLVVVTALAAAASVIAAHRFLGPIRGLTLAARAMAAGRLDARVPVGPSNELGELSRSFNAMASSLQDGERLRHRLTSDIAHELRTPLSNMRGYLEAAQDGVAPLGAELIDSLHEDTLLLQALVSDLGELNAAEAGHLVLDRHEVYLDELATSVAAAHEGAARAVGVSLVVESAAPARALVDGRRIRQVLTNLVTNALRHTEPGGTVRLVARGERGEAIVSVLDDGCGIAPEHLPHLFERFYRADPSRTRATGGSGLGLAITRELVEAHGGTVSVESSLGAGSAFHVRLPALERG